MRADAPLIFTAALLRPQKALRVLLEAFSRVAAAVKSSHLLIAGDGPLHDELSDEIRQLGLEGRAHLLGRRADVDALLAAADVGAMSSDFEGMPLFGFECLAAGKPLVATAVGALPDVITEGREGLLVPPRNPAALATALIAVLAIASGPREWAEPGSKRRRSTRSRR